MRTLSPDMVTELLEEMGLALIGDKVALVRDEAATTYGNSDIYVAEDFKGAPMTGTVVWHGTDIDEDRSAYLWYGQKVRFQRVGAVEDRIVFADGSAANIIIVSSRDVFYSYPDVEEE